MTTTRGIAQRSVGIGFFPLLTGLAMAAVVYFGTRDWICAPLGVGILGFCAAALSYRLIDWQRRRANRPVTFRMNLKTRALILLALVACSILLAVWSFTHLDAEVFTEAFGMPPPASVKNLHAERHYAGGPGDMICLLRFQTDRPTLARIVAARSLAPDTDLISAYTTDGRFDGPGFWKGAALRAARHNSAWASVPPLAQPEVYRWFSAEGGRIHDLWLLWDAQTGEAYAIYTSG